MSDIKKEQDALEIVNDPANRVTKEAMSQEDIENVMLQSGVSRRNLLKYSGAAAAALSVAGSAVTGFKLARTGDAYSGWESYLGETQFFNREPFRAETAAMMTPVAEVTRPDWTDQLLERWITVLMLVRSKKWNPSMGLEAMPNEAMKKYYTKHPERYELVVERIAAYFKRLDYWNNEVYDRYSLANAYAQAYNVAQTNRYGSAIPENPEDALRITGKPQPPEEWDFRRIPKNKKKMEFKSPKHASELIKTMGHLFGASFVAITPFDKSLMFTNLMRGMPNKGKDDWGDKVPEHWKSMIVLGTPMFWDSTYGAIGYSTSNDGYFRTRVAAGLLEVFLQTLGHPARAQFPGNFMEVMMSAFALKSGLAEYSRSGLVMVPEVGSNFRSGGVITDIEFEYDKPININMANFCKKCKICADTCPGGAIETTDEPTQVIRGMKRWVLDEERCHRMWVAGSTQGGDGCRVCIAVCPFTRKNTWIHAISRELDARDATGLVGTSLLLMQQNFFKYPRGEEFRGTWDGGKEAHYHNPPMWERPEEWFSNIDKDWEYNGMY